MSIIKRCNIAVIAILLAITFTNCKKEKKTIPDGTISNAMYITDCTGSYLRVDGKDYAICNIEKMNAVATGQINTVTYRRLDDCPAAESRVICMMLHENEGWIEILEIK